MEPLGPDQQGSSEKVLRRINRLAKKRRLNACAEEQQTIETPNETNAPAIEKKLEGKHRSKKKEKVMRTEKVAVYEERKPNSKKKRKSKHHQADVIGCGPTDVYEIKKTNKSKRKSKEIEINVEVNSSDDRVSLPMKKRKHEKKEKKEVSQLDSAGQNGFSLKQDQDSIQSPNESGLPPKKKIKARRRRKPLTSSDPSAEKKPKENGDTVGGYTVIGEIVNKRPQKVKRILPDWLAKPTIVSIDLGGQLTPIDAIAELSELLVKRLGQLGISHFFPVQSSVIPWLLKSVTRNWIRQPDLCVSSPTGSGKTLAFVLPVVQALLARVVCSIKAVVVLPVRDLAMQVYKVFDAYCAGTQLRVGLAVGERVLSTERDSLLKNGKSLIDILVCTPGRLVDHISQTPGFSLEDLRFLIIDEADRMIQLIKQDWLNEVEKFVLKNRGLIANSAMTVARMAELRRMPQKLLFSATLSQDPQKLKEVKLFQPKLFTSIIPTDDYKSFNENVQDDSVGEFIGKYTTPMELNEAYVECENFLKPLVLLHIIHNVGYRHLLCFTNTVESSHRLSLLLSTYGGIDVQEYSSKLSDVARNKILIDFHKGAIDVIVCSDAMTRGMDVKDVDYVISYDLPLHLKTYIHRVGRTARAGRKGTAITLVQNKEVSLFRKMMLSRNLTMDPMIIDTKLLEPMEKRYKNALERMKEKVLEENLKGPL